MSDNRAESVARRTRSTARATESKMAAAVYTPLPGDPPSDGGATLSASLTNQKKMCHHSFAVSVHW